MFAWLNIGKPGIAGAILQDPQKADNHRRTAQDRVFRRHWLGYEGPVSQLGSTAARRVDTAAGRPVQERVEFFGHDLRNHERDKKAQEEQGSGP